ncbi:glycosyltransferase [Belnapia rosea]|uniref:Cellulose synthase (UDP-forming) n=1 Tax=Belnapia rosea TaxID=938405 RepID=A0A1G6YBX7_9PROT|nr:glycosyltransferase [Belnapia rosea]SDD87878.1 cellulose synthase (UDP-forming) [Belnapia rosea]
MEPLAPSFLPCFLVISLSLLLPYVRPTQPLARLIGAGLTAALLVRYLLWRALETLPSLTPDPLAIAGWVFFLLELLGSAAGLILLHVLSRSCDRSAEATAHPVEDFPGGAPLIDLLIPTYNEQSEILYRTIIGALSQDYPRFRVWVLDDGKRSWLADMCRELGAGYRIRGDNSHGKAGNMNAAFWWLMDQPEPPDAIGVLDADFVATPAFLRRAAALLHDPKVALVQTPQHFFNPDPIQLNLGAATLIPDEQRFFFDVILASKDAHGTAFSCGTSALVRASSLAGIGGFPTESVTEDLLMSIKLSGLGLRTVYLNEPLTAGLAPEGLQEYLTQRGRWCLGTMQIVRTPWGPWSRGPTPPLMRLHTLDTVLFWTMTPILRIICLVIPVLYWWTGLVVVQADLPGLVSNLGPYWLSCVIFLGWVSGGTNVPVLADAMSLLVARESLRASAIGLFGSRNQKFKVTAKGATRDRTVVQWDLVAVFMGLAGLTLGGIILRAVTGPIAGTPPDVEAMTLFWSLYNLVTLCVAALMCVEAPRYRKEERFATDEPVEITIGGQTYAGRMDNLSLVGCRVRFADLPLIELGAEITLYVPGVGTVPTQVRGLRARSCQLSFNPDSAQRAALVRKLFSGQYRKSVSTLNPLVFCAILWRRAFT